MKINRQINKNTAKMLGTALAMTAGLAANLGYDFQPYDSAYRSGFTKPLMPLKFRLARKKRNKKAKLSRKVNRQRN